MLDWLKWLLRGWWHWLVRAAWLVSPSGADEPDIPESERRTLGARFSRGHFAVTALVGVALLAVLGGPAAYVVRFATADIPLGEIQRDVGVGAVATAVLVPLA